MCLPQKCCIYFSLKKGNEIIILYDGILVALYALAAFAFTLLVEFQHYQTHNSQISLALVWTLLSLFLVKFTSGAFVNRSQFKADVVMVYFVARLMSTSILLVLSLITLVVSFNLELMIFSFFYFTLEAYFLCVNYAFYRALLKIQEKRVLPKAPIETPHVIQPKLAGETRFIPKRKANLSNVSKYSQNESISDLSFQEEFKMTRMETKFTQKTIEKL